MRVSSDQLIFHSLCVLEQLRARCEDGPVDPDCDARLALAVLFAFSKNGDRGCYDGFWHNLTAPQHQDREHMENVCRANQALRFINGIMRDVGAPLDPEYAARVSAEAHRLERKARGAVPP